MKGWKTALFLASWLILGWLSLKDTPLWSKLAAFNNHNAIISLGEAPAYDYGRMGFTRGIVRASPDNGGWTVGTDNGQVIGLNRRGELRWRRYLGIGKMIAMTYSNDGSCVLVGEQSPSGNVYMLDAATGNVLWTYSTADLVGADMNLRSYPSVMRIQTDEAGNYYIAAFRYARKNNVLSEYAGRICSLTQNGKVRWLFPDKQAMDAWVSWFAVDRQGESLVFATANFESEASIAYQSNLYWLQGQNGKLVGETVIPPIAYYGRTVMRGSPNYSRDGKLLAAMASDGRGFVYNRAGELLWERQVSKPQLIGDSWINAVGRDALSTKYGVAFTMVNTYNRDNWQLATPLEHPSSNSFFMFNNDGAFQYQWRAGGGIEEVDVGNDIAVIGVGRNMRTRDIGVHGAAVLRLSDGKLLDKLSTEGPCQAVALSADGKSIAAIEAPALMPDGKIIGAYRLHIHDIKED